MLLYYSTISTMWGRPDDEDEWNSTSISIAVCIVCCLSIDSSVMCMYGCMYVWQGMVVCCHFVNIPHVLLTSAVHHHCHNIHI